MITCKTCGEKSDEKYCSLGCFLNDPTRHDEATNERLENEDEKI